MASQAQINRLLEDALHDSVTEERLTKLETDDTRYLFDKPLIEYLEEHEQPHFIFSARLNPPDVGDHSSLTEIQQHPGGRTMHLVTDKRWLVVAANDENTDQTLEIPLETISDIESTKGRFFGSFKLTLATDDGPVQIPIANLHDSSEIEDVITYLEAWPETEGLDFETHHDTSGTEQDQKDRETGSLIGKIIAGAVGASIGIVGGVALVIIGMIILLVIASPLLYPFSLGIICKGPGGLPDFVVGLAEVYYNTFSGLYGGTGCADIPG